MRSLVVLLLLAPALAACGNLVPDGKSQRTTAAPARSQAIAISPQGQQCLAQLSATGSRFEALPDKYYGAGCSAINAVSLSSLAGDRSSLELANIGPVTCPTAEALSGWARFGVDRAARKILGSPLRRIETMGSYACRNVAGSSKRSAHARAEAVDVAAFVLEDGRRISVLDHWHGGSREEREFLRVVQQSACKRFGTVLSPEYNAAHHDHLHLEWGPSSFCR
ncbi:extensin family protein [Erythrobacter sp. SDW2]|uniref:extensin family protein n=1 Tax=Erythrobacter sp. SDW2 TaxID=2907154 RepID=UPI001F2DB7F5|nr:extensin family protein [Erythrobacter sp. SDW2]UIP07888.1 extensin family protein [Erythrobacter sp. SDW2]